MRYQKIPRWTNVMLVVMGIGFIIGSVAFALFVPAPTGAIVGGIWFVMGGGMAFFAARAIKGAADDDRIAREGSAATATVLSAATTGWTINNVPQWKLNLRVDGLGAPYETVLKLMTYTPPENGASFAVRVDPLRHDRVVLSDDQNAAGAAGSADPRVAAAVGAAAPQVQAAVLEALRKAGLGQGETAVVNADGSRTITSSAVTIGGDDDDGPGAAHTVRLLADLDRMRASGSLDEAEFATIKRKLLGEAE